MPKTQVILTFFVALLVGLILYQSWTDHNLDGWIKGVAVICVVSFFARLFEKYRGKRKEK